MTGKGDGMVWWMGLCFLLVVLFLLFSRVKAVLQYTYSPVDGNVIHIAIYFYHIRIYHTDINPKYLPQYPHIRQSWKNQTFSEQVKSLPSTVETMFHQLSDKYRT